MHEEAMILNEVIIERARQVAKWGTERQQMVDRGHRAHLYHKMVVLGEEYGEACKALLETDLPNLRTELIQCAAVCLAFVRSIDLHSEHPEEETNA